MKYGEKFTAEKEVVGIPAEEFENVIMTYLPVTKEELKELLLKLRTFCDDMETIIKYEELLKRP